MSAIVTDQFRVQNASTFIDSLSNNSYYVFVGLSNPGIVGFGRTTTWTDSPTSPPPPTDNLNYLSHYRDTILFGKKFTSDGVRRVIRKIQWTPNTKYDMYRHDYDIYNKAPNSESSRLYDSNYYVVNKDYRVYICLYNGSSGSNINGEPSQDEPLFTDLEPSFAGDGSDGYIWKYLFTISPSDIVKFDSTEYIVLPNDWSTSTDFEIKSVKDSGDSSINNNQIKIVYIENSGGGGAYESGTYPILGDGTGAEVQITTNTSGEIIKTRVTNGGRGYTYGIVDLKTPGSVSESNRAKLIPIIPPSKGHGYDLYTELGADRVLIYSRFDTSTKEFSSDTKFSQVGIIKNPQKQDSSEIFTDKTFSGLHSIKLNSTPDTYPVIGEIISQNRVSDNRVSQGYVASYDTETNILKYYQDRSLYFTNNVDQTDRSNISSTGQLLEFESSSNSINAPSGFEGSVDTTFNGSTITIDGSIVGLGVTFSGGIAAPEINKRTGDIIYIDNRSIVTRSIRQKEDIKIILEF